MRRVRLPDVSSLVTRPVLYLCAAGLIATAFLPPDGFGSSSCTFLLVTGRPCTGCGLTRAMTSVTHFELGKAWYYHPFSFLLWPLMVLLASAAFIAPLRRWLLDGVRRHGRLASGAFWGTFALFMIYGLARTFWVFL